MPPAAAAPLLLLRRPQRIAYAALGVGAAGAGPFALLLLCLLLRLSAARQAACGQSSGWEQGVWAAGVAAAAAPTPHVGSEAAPTSCISHRLTPAAAERRRKWHACQRARRLPAGRRGSARRLRYTAVHQTDSGLKAQGRSIAATGVLISNPRGRLGQGRASSKQAIAPNDYTNRGADGSRPAWSLTA